MPTPFSHPCHENIIVLSCRKGTEGSLHHPKIVEFCGEIFFCVVSVVAGSEHNCICLVSSHHLLLSNFQQGQEEEKDFLITFEKCEQGVRKFDSTAFCYVQHSWFNTAKEWTFRYVLDILASLKNCTTFHSFTSVRQLSGGRDENKLNRSSNQVPIISFLEHWRFWWTFSNVNKLV